MAPTRKRPKLAQLDATPASARLSLTSLPIEILAEILIRTCSPATVLAVSRTCSFLYRTLALNPAASFIWRSVRKTCEPLPLPEPEVRGWKMNEAKYAALVFGGGVCEVCRKYTREMYASFAARIRLCGSWHCRRKFRDECLVRAPLSLEDRKRIWVPCVESNVCFRTSIIPWDWPAHDRVLLFRKADFSRFQLDLPRYKAATDAEAIRELAGGFPFEGDLSNLDLMDRCDAAMKRIPIIMELSVRLAHWKFSYDRAHKMIKSGNKLFTKALAEGAGWDFEDLIASQVYGSMQRRKSFLLEPISSYDVASIRSAIESELLAMQARHKRQKTEASHKDNMTELKIFYERMRCGTTEASGSDDPLILPTPSVFFTLPSVRVLKGSPDPSAAPPNGTFTTGDIKSSPLATSLIRSDIHTWLIPVEKHLMRLLGYPNGWQSASTRTLPPLKRVTARFFCRRCEGKVGKGYQRERCLDFKGVCSHVCVTKQGKRIEGGEEEPQEGETTDTGTKSGPEKGKRRGKKKKCVKTLDWAVDMFEKDDKAIRLIQTLIGLTGLSEEDPCTVSELQAKEGIIRCTTCTGWVVMNFDTATGHAHRHESMQIQLLPLSAPEHVVASTDTAKPPLASSRLAFERGNAELLLGSSFRARRLSKKVNYGCRHCILVGEGDQFSVDVNGKGARAMNFNGLRSHAKEKHGISDVRDEDFFCYTCIQGDDGEDQEEQLIC